MRWAACAFIAAFIGMTATAAAHGPCNCLSPNSGPPGTEVSVGSPSFKIVFSPDRAETVYGPKSLWRTRPPGPPPRVVFRTTYRYEPRPDPNAPSPTFDVPEVPPGRYGVVIFDGSEGGQHYTWDFFRVTDASASSQAKRSDQPNRASPKTAEASSGVGVMIALAGVVGGLALGVALGLSLRRFRGERGSGGPPPSRLG